MLYHPSTILLCFYSHAKSPTRLMAPPFHTRIYKYLDFVHGRSRRRRKKLRRTMKYSLAKHHLAIIYTFCCTWSVGSAGLRCHIVALLEVTKTGTQISLANPLRFILLVSVPFSMDTIGTFEWNEKRKMDYSKASQARQVFIGKLQRLKMEWGVGGRQWNAHFGIFEIFPNIFIYKKFIIRASK